jgi:hypothetical protein
LLRFTWPRDFLVALIGDLPRLGLGRS